MSSCFQYTTSSTGIQPGTELSVYDLELASPLTASQPYAFSVKVTLADAEKEQTIELWSADDKCGLGQEKLWEGQMELGILCAELTPTANHSRLLMAWKGEGSRGTTDIAPLPRRILPTLINAQVPSVAERGYARSGRRLTKSSQATSR